MLETLLALFEKVYSFDVAHIKALCMLLKVTFHVVEIIFLNDDPDQFNRNHFIDVLRVFVIMHTLLQRSQNPHQKNQSQGQHFEHKQNPQQNHTEELCFIVMMPHEEVLYFFDEVNDQEHHVLSHCEYLLESTIFTIDAPFFPASELKLP